MGKIIGIDIGTTHSVAAFLQNEKPLIILSPEGDRLLPSIVAFKPDGERLVGMPAKSQMTTNINTIYSVKKLVGKTFSEVEPYLYQFNYKIVEGKDNTLRIKGNGDLYSPEEITAMILQKLVASSENYLDDTIDGAIITVPAYFNDSQRQATKDGAEIAGINVLRIINEPTAASLAFSLDLKEDTNVLVYDFGGGTIDISVLEIKDTIIRVLATAGDINLGGNDFDLLVANLLVREIQEEYKVNLSRNELALQRIRDAAEGAKKELSAVEECEINLPFITETKNGPVHYVRFFRREELETLIQKQIEKTLKICDMALKRSSMAPADIDEVLLVGGTTRIPLVQKMVKEFFGKEPNKKINPDEIVAQGAAIQGSIIKGKSRDILLLDVTPLSLGVKTFGGNFTRIIEANTTIPINKSMVFSTVEDNQDEVEINVYQGEEDIAEDNKLLGKFTLKGIKAAPRGVPRINVTFNINIDGILKVSAMDLSTKKKKEVVVTDSGLLSQDEKKRMRKKIVEFKEDQSPDQDAAETRNRITNLIYSIETSLKFVDPNSQLVAECNALLKKAGSEVNSLDPKGLDEMETKLRVMSHQLKDTSGVGNKVEDKEKPREEPKKKKPDTQPFKTIG